jgi:hypothetical protein
MPRSRLLGINAGQSRSVSSLDWPASVSAAASFFFAGILEQTTPPGKGRAHNSRALLGSLVSTGWSIQTPI